MILLGNVLVSVITRVSGMTQCSTYSMDRASGLFDISHLSLVERVRLRGGGGERREREEAKGEGEKGSF